MEFVKRTTMPYIMIKVDAASQNASVVWKEMDYVNRMLLAKKRNHIKG